MKILAIGDFHGKCPLNLKKICRDNKIELILCTGDYASFHARKDFFKYCYAKDAELEDFIGEKKVEEYAKKDLADAEKILKKLDSVGVPVISTTGNCDHTGFLEVGEKVPKFRFDAGNPFAKMAKKFCIQFIEYKLTKFKDLSIIGYPRSSYPGFASLRKLLRHPSWVLDAFYERKHRKKQFEMLKVLFEKASQPIVFLVHNPPYKTKLDLISDKKAHELAQGEHYGSLITRQLIEKYKPLLCVSGHMHESPGVEMLGSTTVVNTGSAADGRYAIIEIKNNEASAKLYT